MSEPPIEIEDLGITFGDVTVLDGLSVDITAGQFVGVVGPNGTGKTTLLRSINGVITPDTGQVRIFGTAATTLSARERSRRIATVPQNATIGFDFSVREVVEMGRYPYRSRTGWGDPNPDAVDRALERTETTALADRSVTTLSGGERRRVILARALAQETPILLLDEPTASLDINHQIRTLERVDALVEQDKTIIAAIHDLDLAARYCDMVIVIDDGRIRAKGPPADVLTSETVERTYGVPTAVTTDPTTGAASITALSDPAPERGVTVHVLTDRNGQLLARLTRAGFTVTTSVLTEGSPAMAVADSLGIETVSIPPQTPINEAAQGQANSLIGSADVAVLDDIVIGPMNQVILDVARQAERLVIIEDRPFADRNYTSDRAATVYERLCETAEITPSSRIVEAIERRQDQSVSDHEARQSVSKSSE
ncbi:MAG: ATP-binding cassette domain-containing protein [Halobacteriales archaeon]